MFDLEKIKYKKNYLSKVIFKLDYHPILKIKSAISPDFQERIRRDLPVFMENKGIEYKTQISADKKIDETIPVSQWLFSDKDDRFRLTLTYNYLAIEDFKYTSLNEYLNIIENVIDSFLKIYHDVSFARIGLRYINNIFIPNGNPLDWSEYIADSLIYPIQSFIGDKRELSRAMSQFIINKDNCSIVFNFGIFNSEFPERISRKEYILDYDCFSNDVEENNVIEQLKSFNLLILELFERSIKEPLRKLMEIDYE